MRLVLILLLLVALCLALGQDDQQQSVTPPVAAHNPDHWCPSWLLERIINGWQGGTFWLADGSRVTWTDGEYFLVCRPEGQCTFFRCRNAQRYAQRDAQAHHAVPVSADTARDALGWRADEVGAGLMGMGVLLLFLAGLWWLFGCGQQPQGASR